MRSLLDVNVLIALLDSDHASHSAAVDWFTIHAGDGWASCPITQNGCMRIMSHHAYPNTPTLSQVASRLKLVTAHAVHEFWPDDVSLLDPGCIRISRVHGPRQLTDAYLLALAVKHAGRFVTFDRSIALDAVVGVTANQLVLL
jgi:uncharacterized protein